MSSETRQQARMLPFTDLIDELEAERPGTNRADTLTSEILMRVMRLRAINPLPAEALDEPGNAPLDRFAGPVAD